MRSKSAPIGAIASPAFLGRPAFKAQTTSIPDGCVAFFAKRLFPIEEPGRDPVVVFLKLLLNGSHYVDIFGLEERPNVFGP